MCTSSNDLLLHHRSTISVCVFPFSYDIDTKEHRVCGSLSWHVRVVFLAMWLVVLPHFLQCISGEGLLELRYQIQQVNVELGRHCVQLHSLLQTQYFALMNITAAVAQSQAADLVAMVSSCWSSQLSMNQHLYGTSHESVHVFCSI